MMKKLATALSVASAITAALAWAEEHNERPGSALLALQFKKEHALIGVLSGFLVLVG